ncbi:MAG: glycosyltransferase family 2 protein [Rhodobacteraceae bacterium]|nr:glycosyltransferase family 2 protein [Paracoccaceae bacterium]
MQPAAALTILTGDPGGGPENRPEYRPEYRPEGASEQKAFFLKTWAHYYERQISRDHCYVISADAPPELLELAAGCSVIRLPSGSGATVARRRGRVMANMVAALGQYYTHVIVGEPHELVLADPAKGNLNDMLGAIDGGQVLTPLGLDLIPQHIAVDDAGKAARHVRVAPDLCKPCVISAPVALSRDATLAKFKRLATPEDLYLLRQTQGPPTGDTTQEVADMDFGDGFSDLRARMHTTWGKHGNSGYWSFAPPVSSHTYALPARFDGLF